MGSLKLTGGNDEIKIGVSSYDGAGAGFSITIRPQPVIDWLAAHPTPGVDFNTNQHGIGAWQ